jgi:saccharopine dehydrogenase-like NADP-dependent oxidoreductase
MKIQRILCFTYLLVVPIKAFQFLPNKNGVLRTNSILRGVTNSNSNNVIEDVYPISFESIQGKRVLVVGGSGRVGGSVVCQLLKHKALVTVGGTRKESFQESQNRWKTLFPALSDPLQNVSFEVVDREDTKTISKVLNNAKDQGNAFDLIIHTAGPFQGKAKAPNGILEASVNNGINYIDVCDDYCTAMAAKHKYASVAKQNNSSCILSTGCWPGVSSLMAKRLVQHALQNHKNLTPQDINVDFSFFTAGSGGAGATLLVATFLILSEESLVIQNGRRTLVKPMKQYTKVDFGDKVGKKDVAHLNLLEAASCHDILGVGNVKTLFGTDPPFWNTLLGAMCYLPSSVLSNVPLMEKLALFSLPIVRLVDYFAGATNGMRVEVSSSKDPSLKDMALYVHPNLEPCVGECVVAFAAATFSDKIDPGVWFPEEAVVTADDIAQVLKLASVGAHTLNVQSESGLKYSDVWGGQ